MDCSKRYTYYFLFCELGIRSWRFLYLCNVRHCTEQLRHVLGAGLVYYILYPTFCERIKMAAAANQSSCRFIFFDLFEVRITGRKYSRIKSWDQLTSQLQKHRHAMRGGRVFFWGQIATVRITFGVRNRENPIVKRYLQGLN